MPGAAVFAVTEPKFMRPALVGVVVHPLRDCDAARGSAQILAENAKTESRGHPNFRVTGN